ncbi:(2,3-dihydroxybenzoyl)adenylate synthase [Amycolatopsis palatopharyngis]|uniref:(2,3-dihydroxybenzoyl)adenylate synthase n=1 Tax=Amycolatopsis palatopharyngis TaxID=187982 RepID=UPI000E25317F|nr:AMP-binding protein [Amycolatopsis palatopharyngis]
MSGEARSSRTGTVSWPADVVRRYVEDGYWTGEPIGARLLATAAEVPDKVALVDGELRLTYRELMERVDGAALRLHALGLRPDDRIVVQLPNRWEFVVLTLACFRLGVLPVMALPAHRKHEIGHLVEQAEAKALAVPAHTGDFDHQAMAEGVAAESGFVQHVLVAGTAARAGSVPLGELCMPASVPVEARTELDRLAPESRSVALFLLSGGTTGLPKLIARTHDDYAYGATCSAAVCGFGPETVYLALLPMSHNFTLAGPGVLGTLLTGGRVVIGSSPAAVPAFELIERERVTVTSVVPAIVQRWLDQHDSLRKHGIDSLGLLQVGGARLADHIAQRVDPVLGCRLQQGYGMAEGLICFTRPHDDEAVTCHTQGRPISEGDEVLVVDENDEPVAPGQPGALLTRGPYTVRGYYRAPEHNALAFTVDGWYRTGDVVRQLTNGNLIIEGRDKDMINRGGEKISAEEVENFAYQVDGILQAAAVAMPDPELGERVCLYIVPRAGEQIDLGDVLAVLEQAGVARFKHPDRLVLVDALPVTNIGKIDKKALREDITARMAA